MQDSPQLASFGEKIKLGWSQNYRLAWDFIVVLTLTTDRKSSFKVTDWTLFNLLPLYMTMTLTFKQNLVQGNNTPFTYMHFMSKVNADTAMEGKK